MQAPVALHVPDRRDRAAEAEDAKPQEVAEEAIKGDLLAGYLLFRLDGGCHVIPL